MSLAPARAWTTTLATATRKLCPHAPMSSVASQPPFDASPRTPPSIGFFNQARKDAVIQGPLKHYAPITGAEFIAQAMKRNYDAALKAAKLQTYEISEANRDAVVSGTGLEKSEVVGVEA